MEYSHTQKAPLYYLMLAFAAVLAVNAILLADEIVVATLLGAAALFFVALGFSFARLRIEDEGQRLLVQYGPLPLFWRRIEYGEIQSVARGRSSWIDGWGIHWVPGRGWTYNLWGFDCVELDLAKTTLRLGTDDAQNLTDFLAGKMRRRGAATSG